MWEQITGQRQVTSILQRSISRGNIAHAYLFAGPRGTGKKKTAVQLAKSLFCMNPVDGDSCETCINCRRIEHGNHPDLHIVDPDGGSIKIAQIRELRREFSYSALESKRKVYIVSDAETMTKEAANSLLKFLEEPAANITAILLTTNLHSILPTIRSRCQLLTFANPSWKEVSAYLIQKGVAEGSARVAAQIFGNADEAYEHSQREAFAQVRKIVIQFYKDNSRAIDSVIRLNELLFANAQIRDEIDLFLDMSLVWYRDLVQVLLGNLENVANLDHIEILNKQAKNYTLVKATASMETILKTQARMKWMNSQLALEQMVLHLGGFNQHV